MSYTVGQLGKAFGLSRSALLYYDKLGLLSPSGRSEGNYRLYTEQDYQRLAKIMTYRDTGLPLQAIRELLTDAVVGKRVSVLEAQLERLNQEIAGLRKQQQITLELLASKGIDLPARVMNKDQWVALLASSGMSNEDMMQWHRVFEQRMPEAHQDFLESLNIPSAEIAEIRRWSKEEASAGG